MSDIPTITPDDEYSEVIECDYKGEHYSVRDNGAIMRHAREGKPIRKDDNVWTFGKKDEKTGYMIFCSARVHIIVATAFHGEHDSTKLVVDHIDTNRCNNRPDNLRWLTRLENALNNPATLKKITYLCGGDIQKFLDSPSCLRDITGTNQDVMWMRTVTADEAKAAYAHIMEWAEKPSSETPSKGGRMGEWLYRPQNNDWQPDFSNRDKPNEPSSKSNEHHKQETVRDLKFTGDEGLMRAMLYAPWGNPLNTERPSKPKIDIPEVQSIVFKSVTGDEHKYVISDSITHSALQGNWRTPTEFLCCPQTVSDTPLEDYLANLSIGKTFLKSQRGESVVEDFAISDDKKHLWVLAKQEGEIKPWAVTEIVMYQNHFLHLSRHTFFSEIGGHKYYTLEQGKEWTGEDCIDDYC